MKQKLILSTILMIVLAMPKVAVAYNFSAVAPSGQMLYYNIIGVDAEVTFPLENYFGDGGNYNGYTKPTGSLTIPNSVSYRGITYSVTTIGAWAFNECSGLTSITIPNSVTSIGYNAFLGCTGLTSVTIGNSVKSIPSHAFKGCNELTSVIIGNSVRYIGEYAFSYCSGLTSVTIPNSVTSIGQRAFNECYNLTSVTIGNSVTTIGEYAFNDCRGLTSVTIPNSVTTISEGAFTLCRGLTSVTIGNSVRSIGEYAFSHCRGLTSVTIPNSVTSIGQRAFSGCTGLTSVTISNSVRIIEDYTFYLCDNMRIITLGRSVDSIRSEAFKECIGLVNITCRSMTPPKVQNRNVFQGLSGFVVLRVPCGAAGVYATTAPWSRFDIREVVDIVAVPNDLGCGTVTIVTEPTCTNREAQVQANPYYGYHFDHWSDGNRDNPRRIVVQRDTTIIAYFYSDNGGDGIEETAEAGVKLYQSNGQIVVEGAEGSRVMVYDVYGRLLAVKRDEGGLLRFDVPAVGVYLVRVGDAPARKVAVVR